MEVVHTVESLSPELSEVEIETEKLERYKSAGNDQIPAKWIQAGVKLDVLRSIN
jgi:hypothetical protein